MVEREVHLECLGASRKFSLHLGLGNVTGLACGPGGVTVAPLTVPLE